MNELLAGRYELGALLGRGGMGEVVEASDRRLERRVAVKLLPADVVDPVARLRFLDEARSGARFTHPHAVAVYDAGQSGDWLYLVMELVEGPSLAEVITEQGRLPAAEAARIAGAVLDALGAAHGAGVVHRDVKPGNVLLGPGGAVKLADFGIAKRLDDTVADRTVAGQFVGTPRYLAPEQLMGERATPASDVYATGVLLFEMLAGRPPFDGDHAIAIALSHRDAPVPALATAAPGTPPALAAAVERALAKDPAERFPSAAAMAAAVRASAAAAGTAGPPVVAVAATPRSAADVAPAATEVLPTSGSGLMPLASRLGADRRRHRMVAAAAVALVLVLVGVLALASGDGDEVGSGDTTPPTVPNAVTTVVAAAPAPAASTATVPPATVRATPAPTLAPTPAPPPGSLEELVSTLAADPGAVGPAGSPLLSRLNELADLQGRRASERAAELLVAVDAWSDGGELDPGFAAVIRDVLDPLAAGPGNGDGNGNGNGDDGGGEGDDD